MLLNWLKLIIWRLFKYVFTTVATLIALGLFCMAQATIQLPTNMNKSDRETALSIIGLGTSEKILSDPYPLGGYAGFEAGISVETFDAEDLGRLGNKLTPPQQESSLPKLTIGKGLYHNVDIFIQFTPYSRQDELAEFGGIVRWGFYQASFLPLSLSVLAHYNDANIANQLASHAYGFDLIGGFNVDNVSLFAGIGPTEATGVFMGGSAGATLANQTTSITDSGVQENEFVSSFHYQIGGNIHFSNYFIAMQIDRYTIPVFSGKLGVRF